jgi:hypothetical protein
MGQHLATNTEEERDEWLEAMRVASYTNIRTKLLELQQKVIYLKKKKKKENEKSFVLCYTFCLLHILVGGENNFS